MQLVATGWLVLQLTDSPAVLGVTAALQSLPIIVCALAGGVIADRFDRYRLMILSQVGQLVPDAALMVLVAIGQVQVWHIFVYSLVSGSVRGLSTPARQAYVPALVPRALLLSAIALNSVLWQGAAVLGPSLAGLVLAAWGTAGNFYLNTASDLINLALLLLIRAPQQPRPPAHSAWRGLLEGTRYAWGEPRVRLLLLTVAAASLLGRSYTQLMPVFARDVLDVGPQGLGALLTMPAVGTIIAALLLATRPDLRHQGRWLLAQSALLAVALGVFALSTWFPLSLAALVIVGGASTAASTLANSLLQHVVVERLRGRVMGFYMAATQGAGPLGALPAGLLAEVAGAPLAVFAGGAALLALIGALVSRASALKRLD